MKVTATVITFNEERTIAEALNSLSWADEIVVVDSGSTDQTVNIAREFTDRIWVRAWPGYSAQKNFASEQATNDWIFNLDADERVSRELALQIESLKRSSEPTVKGFEVPRRTLYFGHWIKHSGWYPDRKLRLFDRKAGCWQGDYVHESVTVDGEVGRLTGEIIHHTVQSVAEHHLRIDRYTTLAADEMYAAGKRASISSLMFSPLSAFIRSYVIRRGFLDGVAGLAIAYFAADYVFLRTLKLWEKQQTEEGT